MEILLIVLLYLFGVQVLVNSLWNHAVERLLLVSASLLAYHSNLAIRASMVLLVVGCYQVGALLIACFGCVLSADLLHLAGAVNIREIRSEFGIRMLIRSLKPKFLL